MAPRQSTKPYYEHPWHALHHDAVLERLGSHSTHGLSHEEAGARLARHGRNVLETHRGRHWTVILAAQLTDFMILVLFAAAVIAGLLGELEDAVAIIVIVLLNGVVGFVQEYRAERAMAALRRMAPNNARVVRDGATSIVLAEELVPGDIVRLEEGDVVPADIRLTETARLQTEEASLTGESVPVEKGIEITDDREAPLGERTGMAYKGTLVTRGRGRGVVVATGMRTELGKIAALLSADEGKTPLQKRLAQFGRRLAVAVLAICTLLFFAGWLRGEDPLTMFLTAVSLAVAAIPEALPAVVTIALALGAARMVKRNALMRRLPAVETLGSITYICSDKTGTLTENRMRVEACHAGGATHNGPPDLADPDFRALALTMTLCNDAVLNSDGIWLGDPTETALLEAVPRATASEWARRHPRVAEIPFDSRRARMGTLHGEEDGVLVLLKGAPEVVLPLCTARLAGAGDVPLDRAREERTVRELAGEGQRVLAFAMRRLSALPAVVEPDAIEHDLTFVGFVGLVDPPRQEAAAAVRDCKTAGITPVMITGDHAVTATAVAVRLGIAETGTLTLTGRELARLSDEELAERVREVRVYARTSPEQKIRIVDALQAAGEYVAMTGDGVNDAPALKRADIGVAMGKIGTEVAREAASMVLLDDNFATVVSAVREGRRIFDNIRKFVRFVMGGNIGEIATLFFAPFFGLPIPLQPIQILWINLVTDGLPGLALAAEPGEPHLMHRPPRPPTESIFAHGMWQHILWVGLLIGTLSIVTQAWAFSQNVAHSQSMVFSVLTFSQMFQVLAIRSERESLWRIGVLSNRPLLLAVLATFALQLAVLYVPWLQPIFKTAPLSAMELAGCVLLASLVLAAVEVEKWLVRRASRTRHT
jgi:Ca2+-transporting ATPase